MLNLRLLTVRTRGGRDRGNWGSKRGSGRKEGTEETGEGRGAAAGELAPGRPASRGTAPTRGTSGTEAEVERGPLIFECFSENKI